MDGRRPGHVDLLHWPLSNFMKSLVFQMLKFCRICDKLLRLLRIFYSLQSHCIKFVWLFPTVRFQISHISFQQPCWPGGLSVMWGATKRPSHLLFTTITGKPWCGHTLAKGIFPKKKRRKLETIQICQSLWHVRFSGSTKFQIYVRLLVIYSWVGGWSAFL